MILFCIYSFVLAEDENEMTEPQDQPGDEEDHGEDQNGEKDGNQDCVAIEMQGKLCDIV